MSRSQRTDSPSTETIQDDYNQMTVVNRARNQSGTGTLSNYSLSCHDSNLYWQDRETFDQPGYLVPLNDATMTPSQNHSDANLAIVGYHRKRLVKFVQDIRHLGLEDLGVPLPKICVIGDQSTGKSSLNHLSQVKRLT